MNRTYKATDFDSIDINYVEIHETRTSTDDSIETISFSKFFIKCKIDQFFSIEFIKFNIEYFENVNGVAAVLKIVLMLENELILLNFDFRTSSSRISMNEWNIQIRHSI